MHPTSVLFLRELARESAVEVRLRGACMAPQLADGAMVSVRRRRIYLPGDVVVFRTRAGDLAAHRLLGWRLAGLVTKGDHCAVHDAPVPRAMLIGAAAVAVSWRARLRAVTDFARIAARRLRR